MEKAVIPLDTIRQLRGGSESHDLEVTPPVFLKIDLFIGKSDLQRGGETERKILHPKIHSPSERNRPMLCRSEARIQELLPGIPHGCRVPKLWAVLDCFPRPQAGSEWEAWLPGLEPVPIWDPGAFKARTLAARPCRRA